jgi:4-diphosphocytidyl-2-C-methyl-D-erythritol kinase
MTVTRAAHAKLNVFLRVLGRRDDGYHDVETVILPIDLHDVVEVDEHRGFQVEIDGPRAGELETAGEDLIGRAADAWARAGGRGAPNARSPL